MKTPTGFRTLLTSAAFASLALVAQASGLPSSAPVSPAVVTSTSARRDFFAHANAAWLASHRIPDDRPTWSVMMEVTAAVEADIAAIDVGLEAEAANDAEARKLLDFRRAAFASPSRGATPPASVRAYFGELDRAGDVRSLALCAARRHRWGASPLWCFYASQDLEDSDRVAPFVGQSGLTLPDREYYLGDDPALAAVRAKFPAYVRRMLSFSGLTAAESAKLAPAVVAIEERIAAISRPLADLRDPRKNYRRMSPAELRALAPGLPWSEIYEAYGLKPDRDLVVGQSEFFQKLDTLLRESDPAALRAYLRFHAYSQVAPYLGEAVVSAHFEFMQRTLNGVEKPASLELRAQRARDEVMGEAVGRRYVAKRFSPALRERYQKLCEVFREAFATRLRANPWMDDATRAGALEKLSRMRFKVGHPDRWTDYSALPVSADDFAQNMLEGARFAMNRDLALIGGKPDRERWGMNPQVCNAYYDPQNNEMVLPAASFVMPGTDPETMDDAAACGFIGGTIGHEMCHGFDDEGRKYDAAGNLRDWWTPAAAAAFDSRTRRLVAQFSATDGIPGVKINGEATLGENLADLGGMAVSLEAFKRTACFREGLPVAGLSPMQRFFHAYAYSWASMEREAWLRARLLSDFHSPAKARVNLIVPHFEEFHEAFGVRPGDAMWLAPEARVLVW